MSEKPDEGTVFVQTNEGQNANLVGMAPAGPVPSSVTERHGVVYVLCTGSPAVVGFRLAAGGLDPMEGGEHAPASSADPALVGFAPDGFALLVTERGTNSITAFPVQADGSLFTAQTVPSSGPAPYGFAFTSGGTLVVTEAFGAQKGAAAASSGITVDGRPGLRDEWLAGDGRFLYALDADSGSILGWAVRDGGELTPVGAWNGLSASVAGIAAS